MNVGKWLACFLFLLSSCSAPSEEKLRLRGQKVVRDLVLTLRNVENHEELQAASPQLKKQFTKLAYILVEMRTFRSERGSDFELKEPLQENETLFIELARLYEIPGCREIIERSQVDAMYVLLRQ